MTVDNTGAITTAAGHSTGIDAMSIGGGGGEGGDGLSDGLSDGMSLIPQPNSKIVSTVVDQASGEFFKKYDRSPSGLHSWVVAIGGSGAGGGNGGAVTASNSGAITTAGAYSRGVQAMSVGGGGGIGGEGNAGTDGKFGLGGTGGAAGDGGVVTLEMPGRTASSAWAARAATPTRSTPPRSVAAAVRRAMRRPSMPHLAEARGRAAAAGTVSVMSTAGASPRGRPERHRHRRQVDRRRRRRRRQGHRPGRPRRQRRGGR